MHADCPGRELARVCVSEAAAPSVASWSLVLPNDKHMPTRKRFSTDSVCGRRPSTVSGDANNTDDADVGAPKLHSYTYKTDISDTRL